MEETEGIQGRLEQAIMAMGDEWLLVLEIDLKKDAYTVLHDNLRGFGVELADGGSYSQLNHQVRELVAEEYQTYRTQFCSPENLRDVMRERPRAECEYVVTAGKNTWRRDVFQVMEREAEVPVRVVWFHVNIDQRKAEELKEHQLVEEAYMLSEQAYAVKNMYINRISTELQTPMNVIIGNTAVAKAFSTDSDRVEECLDQIATSTKAMFQMIRQIARMDALEEGNTILQLREVSILELWKAALDMLRPSLRLHHHSLNTSRVDIRHNYVRADVLMLRQIITNLLQNAVNYTPSGGEITVSVKEKPIDDRFGLYEFCVEDNGVGMTEEFRKIMFEPFSREYSDRVGHVQGLGLGLVIVRNLVRLMNGEIRVDSVCGKGTRITVCIELEYGETMQRTQSQVQREIRDLQPDYAGKRVLLVDDNEWTSGVEKQLLATIGMQTAHALNGEDAVRMFSDSPEGYFDLIIMDMGLPGIDGYAVMMGIRHLKRDDGRTIPVIIMTSGAYTDKRNLIEQEIKYRIAKPVSMHELLEVLRRVF